MALSSQKMRVASMMTMGQDVRIIMAFERWRALWAFAISSSCGARTAGNGKVPVRPSAEGVIATNGGPVSTRGDGHHSDQRIIVL